jgi:hypothetical protein
MTAPVELRAERRLWWLCARVRPVRAGQQAKGPGVAFILWTVVAAIVIVANAIAVFGPAGILAGPVALLGIPLGWYLVVFASASWHATGAGRPVLALDGGEVRGRLRPVWADDTGSPRDPGWWDLRLPAGELAGVRIAREGRPTRLHMLALDLPAPARDRLLGLPELAELAPRLVRAAGTPAAWNAGAMLPARRRAARLRELVTALEQARVAGAQQR